MSELETLRSAFVAFLDGLWFGLRENVGALSMYEGYAGGFKQMGLEAAEREGGKGPEAAAKIAIALMTTMGLEVEQNGKEIIVKTSPLWERVLDRGLEYSFHVEEICWKPMLEGIGEKTGTKPIMESSLRLSHVERVKIEYKKGKAKASLDKGDMSRDDFDKQIKALDKAMQEIPVVGRYRFA
jgi:hypothetical protein